MQKHWTIYIFNITGDVDVAYFFSFQDLDKLLLKLLNISVMLNLKLDSI